ncbi:MAG TPA: hypothetical protein VM364_00325 [Vicinamibacterales bacterium]|nr:hypothetical protein [Vicinamibacterales bacterium]
MTDPLRTDRPPSASDLPDGDRDARIEELLLAGLDHYFAEQHELAINVWTRVLFIDRGHARARAYIERARGAIAERQRRADELLHTGSAAFDRGDAATARALVASAVDHGASADQALALLARIERLANLTQEPATPRRRPSAVPRDVPPTRSSRPARWPWIAGAAITGVLLGGAGIGALMTRGIALWPLADPTGSAAPAFQTALPVPTLAEVAFSRGEALFARGRLHEALAALEAVPGGDPLRPRADELAAAIQRQLLDTARSGATRLDPSGRHP